MHRVGTLGLLYTVSMAVEMGFKNLDFYVFNKKKPLKTPKVQILGF